MGLNSRRALSGPGSAARLFALMGVPMRMYVLIAGSGCSGGSYELAVFDAFYADKFVGQLADAPVRPAQDQRLEALVLIEMNVQRRGDQVKGLVLSLGEFAAEIRYVMIVYKR